MPNILEDLADHTLAAKGGQAGRGMLLGVGKFCHLEALPVGNEKSIQSMKERVSSGSLSYCLCYAAAATHGHGPGLLQAGPWEAKPSDNIRLCLSSRGLLLANRGALKFRSAVGWFTQVDERA